jgi:DNA-binding response OmpR family regulator
MASETPRVLVVDDHEAVRFSVSKTLEKDNCYVKSADSGAKALELMREEWFDVVLTDIIMPGLSGVELLRQIKDISPDTVVILMTGYADLETAVEALRLGANDYLIKPSSGEDLRNSVNKGFERARNLRHRRNVLDELRANVLELERADKEDHFQSSAPTPNATTKRNSSQNKKLNSGEKMQFGQLIMFPRRYQISINNYEITLTPTEFELMLYLAVHRDRVVPCYELVREVRGYSADETEAREVIRPHISNLRRKLKEASQDEDLIINMRGLGYRLSETE